MDQQTPISEIIRQRTSRRTYLTEPLSEESLAVILKKIHEIKAGPLGTEIHYRLISLDDVSNQKLKLGTYGFIQGARYFIAGQIDP